MLDMRIARAPLPDAEYQTILHEYNRLTLAEIPMCEFRRWVVESPAGPALHAVLTTEEGRVVGHTSVLPLFARTGDARAVAAMSEYSFVHEDFRKHKIRGYETSGRPAFITLLDQVFQHSLRQGWGPLFASTNEKNQIFTRKVGLRPAEFPLKECLLVLQPSSAARRTPNLSPKQRTALYAAGIVQTGIWSVARLFSPSSNGIHEVPIGSKAIWTQAGKLSFYEDRESACWRYLDGQYIHYVLDHSTHDYVIAKRGGPGRYLRVCQYRLSSPNAVNALVRVLLNQANKDGALGVRWAVYRDADGSERIVDKLRRLGFLCVDRVRILMVHKEFPEYLDSSKWSMSDSHFCFDP